MSGRKARLAKSAMIDVFIILAQRQSDGAPTSGSQR
jgi:hypothetical protein